MSADINRILGELRQDHRNMTLLLNMIERESNHIYEGGDSDFEVIRDIMHYLIVYSDAVHHPKEDCLYAELKAVRPDMTVGFDRITRDHRNISERGLKLRDEVSSVGAGSFNRRKPLVADALRYVNELRSHMQWEELDLFRRCDEMVAEGHTIIVDSNLVSTGDPVFGDNGHTEFSRLLKSIEESLAAGHS